MNMARQTEAHSQMAKSSGSRAAVRASAKLLLNTGDATLVRICPVPELMLEPAADAPRRSQNARRVAQTYLPDRETSPPLAAHRRPLRQAGNVAPAGENEPM